MKKTFYYKFNKIDNCFWAMVLAFIMLVYDKFSCPVSWVLFIICLLAWIYKNILKQACVTVTDNDIKIDHCTPLPWKDVKDFEIKDVSLCGGKMKVLSLIPQKNIKYHYNWLQRNNCNFGAFPIPLYGILSKKDEDEIIKIVKSKVGKDVPAAKTVKTKKKTTKK